MKLSFVLFTAITAHCAWASLVLAAEDTKPADKPAAQDKVAVPTDEVAPSADEAAIRDNAAKYVESFNRRDSHTMASLWSPEGVYIDPDTGERIVGREALEKSFVESFADSGESKLAVDVDSIDFLSPNVAIEKGVATITNPGEKDSQPIVSHYSAVHVKRDGKWMLDRVTEEVDEEPTPSNYEHLKDLEWMIGSWVDADEDPGVEVQTDISWTKNKNFITRSFAVKMPDRVPHAGMQIIGWDPIAKEIHSWTFDSTGAVSEGVWHQKGKAWHVHQHGYLSDGGKTSALNIVTPVDDNTYTFESIHREIDGEMQPNIDEVTIVRNQDQ